MSGQLWAVNTLGGYMSAAKLSKTLRYALFPTCRFRQFCDTKDGSQQGKKKGDTFHWDVYSKVATAGTTIAETDTMPETQFTITQGTLTITEAGNSVPYTGKLDNLSEHPLTEIIDKVIREDATEALDGLAMTQFNATVLRVAGTASGGTLYFTTNGTATQTNNGAMAKSDIGSIVDWMKERNIPAYQGGDYYAIAWPSTYRTLKTDLQSVYQYTTEGLRDIRHGEIGRFENVRFIEQTCIAKGGAADSSTWAIGTADAWDNAKSDWAFFFGQDTVAEAICVPEEVRAKIPTDYGRSKGIAWYYLGGFGLVHSQAADARIVKWDSAS